MDSEIQLNNITQFEARRETIDTGKWGNFRTMAPGPVTVVIECDSPPLAALMDSLLEGSERKIVLNIPGHPQTLSGVVTRCAPAVDIHGRRSATIEVFCHS